MVIRLDSGSDVDRRFPVTRVEHDFNCLIDEACDHRTTFRIKSAVKNGHALIIDPRSQACAPFLIQERIYTTVVKKSTGRTPHLSGEIIRGKSFGVHQQSGCGVDQAI